MSCPLRCHKGSAEITGYQDGCWASFKQWQQIGAQVRRGEKGTPVVFYKELQRRGGDAAAGGPISGQFEGAAAEATGSGTYLMAKSSYVFNAAQVEGDTPPERPELPGLAVRLESAERFVAATGAVIAHGGDRAYYKPAEDRIQLPPPEQFRSSEGYYATALHELTHWSGHRSRLERDLKGRFGTAAYAAEELVAEIGAAFLCVKAGVTAEPREDHAHYLKSWIAVPGAYSVLAKQQLTFLVAPKDKSSNLPLPKRSIVPYFAVAVICGLVLIIAGDRHKVEDYYLLALMSGITFATALALIISLYALESGYARKRPFLGRLTIPMTAFALLGLGGWLRLGVGVKAIARTGYDGLSSMEKLAGLPMAQHHPQTAEPLCLHHPCFGSYDFHGTLKLARIRSDLSHHFLYWGRSHAGEIAKTLQIDGSLGRISLITLEPWPWALLATLDKEKFNRQEQEGNVRLLIRLQSGFYDDEISVSLREFQKASPRTVYVRLMHEMEKTGQYPWSPLQPLDFIRSYRHIVNLSREMGIRNIRWVWSPAGDPKAADFWPGADYVDHIGLSIYATREWPSTTSLSGQIPSLASLLNDKLWVLKYGKPTLLAEVGVNGSEAEKMAWLRDATQHLCSSPSVWAWVYFDAKQPKFMPTEIGLPDWSLSQSQAVYLKDLLSSACVQQFSSVESR